ncbi:unnamed protein product [Brassica oleracea]
MVFSPQGVCGFSFFWRCHLKLSGSACGVPGEVARGVVYALASSLGISASFLPSLITALLCPPEVHILVEKSLEPSSCSKRWSAWAFVVVRESPEPNSLSVAACWFGVFPSTEFGFSGFGRMSLPLPQDRV